MSALADLSYTEGYDLGGQDFQAGSPPRVTMPRTSNASAGRFGYCDGYADAKERGWTPLDMGFSETGRSSSLDYPKDPTR